MEYVSSITSRYIPEEDRIRLAVETRSGQSYELWLSQRMLRAFIPRLSLEVGTNITAHYRAPADTSLASPSAPVVLQAGAISWLINSIELASMSGHVLVMFVNPKQPKEKLVWALLPTMAQQWLKILHSQSELAYWSSIDWPSWLSMPQPMAAPEGVNIH